VAVEGSGEGGEEERGAVGYEGVEVAGDGRSLRQTWLESSSRRPWT
jgi:hypothetical protein